MPFKYILAKRNSVVINILSTSSITHRPVLICIFNRGPKKKLFPAATLIWFSETPPKKTCALFIVGDLGHRVITTRLYCLLFYVIRCRWRKLITKKRSSTPLLLSLSLQFLLYVLLLNAFRSNRVCANFVVALLLLVNCARAFKINMHDLAVYASFHCFLSFWIDAFETFSVLFSLFSLLRFRAQTIIIEF